MPKGRVLSPVLPSVFSLAPDLLFDCLGVHEFAKQLTALQSTIPSHQRAKLRGHWVIQEQSPDPKTGRQQLKLGNS